MRSATRTLVSTFGTLAGVMGIEHGVGEVLQGNVAPPALVFPSWPEDGLFRVLAGEPAMSILPNLLAAGIVTIGVSLAFVAWAIAFVHHKHGGLVLIGLSGVLLLAGGGFGPPVLGILLGLTATRIRAPRAGSGPVAGGPRRLVERVWPWVFWACLAAWLALCPGSILLDATVGVSDPEALVPVLVFTAFGLLLLAIVLSLVCDAGRGAARQPARGS